MQVTEIYQRRNLIIKRGGSSLTKMHFYKAVSSCAMLQVFTAVLIKVQVFGKMECCTPAVQLVTDM